MGLIYEAYNWFLARNLRKRRRMLQAEMDRMFSEFDKVPGGCCTACMFGSVFADITFQIEIIGLRLGEIEY